MPDFPKLIRVERVGYSFRLEIDGKTFPYAVADEPIETRMEPGGFASLRFTLYCDRLEIVDDPFPKVDTRRAPDGLPEAALDSLAKQAQAAMGGGDDA